MIVLATYEDIMNIIKFENSELQEVPPVLNMYLAKQSKGSLRARTIDINNIAEIVGIEAEAMPWHMLRNPHTEIIRQGLIEAGHKYTYINRILSTLRGMLKTAWLAELMTTDDYHRAIAVKDVRGESLPTGREVSKGEILAIMQACENDPSPAGARDASLIGVLYGGGLRRAEAVALKLSDYNPETGELVVSGKGNKERLAYMKNGGGRALVDWLNIRGSEPGALFVPINKGGNFEIKEMTTQAVFNILRKRSIEAGVAEFSPHDLRRSFVSHLLEAGADISTVSKMAGHASIETTKRYDKRGEVAKEKASELLHVPYSGSAK